MSADEKDIPTTVQTDHVAEMACEKCGSILNISAYESFSKVACAKCGTEQAVPARLGTFLLTGLLGHGGMGVAFRGRDEALNRPVAVKIMLGALGSDAEFVRNFKHEAQAAAALNHPNVVQIYSFGVEKGQPYIVMELLTGGKLDAMIAKGEKLDQALVMGIGLDVAEGLHAANSIGLIHGDVKPENILLDSGGKAKVVDFGLAHFRGSSQPDGIWGTPYYIAPEKIKRLPHDARSDIYSLGATLFHALAGKPPFEGKTPIDVVKARLVKAAPKVSSMRPDIDPEIDTIISRMLEIEPALRYPSYASLIADMRRVLARLQPSPGAGLKTLKKGGKLILTKTRMAPTKVGSESAHSASGGERISGKMTSTGGARGGIFDIGGDSSASTARSGKVKKILVAVLIVIAVAGAVVGALLAVQHSRKVSQETTALQTHLYFMQQQRASISGTAAEGLKAVSNATIAAAAATADHREALKLADGNREAVASLKPAISSEFGALTINGDKLKTVLDQFPTNLFLLRELGDKITAAAATLMPTSAVVATNIDLRLAVEAQSTQLVAGLTATLSEIREIEKIIDEAAGTLKTAYEQVKAFQPRFERAKAEADEEARKEAAKRAAEEERKRQEEEKQRLADEKLQKIQQEQEQIKAARLELAAEIRQNRFAQARDSFEERLKGIVTPEGVKARAAGLERYERLIKIKRYVIERINKDAEAAPEGYRYGWLIGGIGARDVIGATMDEVEVKNMGKVVWEKVPVAQILRFFNHYLKEAPTEDTVVRGEMLLAAGVYCYEASDAGENKDALRMAIAYVEDAVRENPRLSDKVRELMGDITR